MNRFGFVDDKVLQANLNLALDHVNELVTVSESKEYKGRQVQISSFRKTIIIHTAAIIEALLLWKLKKVCTESKIELDGEWKYSDTKVLHEISESEQIVAGKRATKKKRIDKLDFVQITKLCSKHGVIKSEMLVDDIDRIRELRNRQHLGGLSEVEKKYSKTNIEFCFNVAERVVNATST